MRASVRGLSGCIHFQGLPWCRRGESISCPCRIGAGYTLLRFLLFQSFIKPTSTMKSGTHSPSVETLFRLDRTEGAWVLDLRLNALFNDENPILFLAMVVYRSRHVYRKAYRAQVQASSVFPKTLNSYNILIGPVSLNLMGVKETGKLWRLLFIKAGKSFDQTAQKTPLEAAVIWVPALGCE